MKSIVLITMLLMVGVADANEIFPTGCLPILVHQESLKLSAKKPHLVMIHNLSQSDLWITHPVSDPGASAGFSSHLKAGNWSALLLEKQAFELNCIESVPGHEQQVPCAGLLAACQWPKVKLSKNNKGTFWAGEDMALSALKAHVGSRGIVILKIESPSLE
jgi:hypothetical protein